jgi:hypothetical protein
VAFGSESSARFLQILLVTLVILITIKWNYGAASFWHLTQSGELET